MKKLYFILFLLASSTLLQAQYNTLTIPEAYYGTSGADGVTFNLSIKDTVKQLRTTGNTTVTGAISSPNLKTNFWGPTLIMNKNDVVHLNVTNHLNEETTIHWHGMHLPAVMDGGPHQVIPAGTVWQPYWTVLNQAATLWYHPHLHEMTQTQITKGVGGFIIVKDPQEAALNLPRTYGVDDIVLALTSRGYTTANQFNAPPGSTRAYGDYMLVNGTASPQISLPKQYVRLRILNAEIERGYNLGFSDNRTFYIIGNDGGLLNAPVAATRIKLMVGERVEIMVNLGADAVGSSFDLKAYNSGQSNSFPGGEPGTGGQFGSLLNNIDFNILRINVASTTTAPTPVTAVPSALVTNTYWTTTDATVNRTVAITGGQNGGATPFTFDNNLFALNTINKTVNLNAIESWTITNTNGVFGHAFHLHDVEFKIVSRSTGAVGAYESGWKDTFFISKNESVTFVAKFDDFADSDVNHPYMYHCHFATHEDEGMMGQFIVTAPLSNNQNTLDTDFSLFPNPASEKLYINLKDIDAEIYYITITTLEGRVAMLLPQPQWKNGIDISYLSSGIYLIKIMDMKTKSITTKKFIKK
jgi:bilirubin oxidase